jgi:hypothetical protein
MRSIVLSLLLGISLAGLARAQQETTGETAEQVRKVIMNFERQKQNCFSPIGEVINTWCADWVKWHDADGIVHYTDDRVRPKAELMDELRSGMRRNLMARQTGHVIHIYGDGDDGTTAVVTYEGEGGGVGMGAMYGIPINSGGHSLGIDVWQKVDGRWWFVVHCPHHW